jgi:mono/diheme cytochrome c family protein
MMRKSFWTVFTLLAVISLFVVACEPTEVEPELTPINGIPEDRPPTPTLVPPTPTPAEVTPAEEQPEPDDETMPETGDPFQAGLQIYQEACAACHQSGGEGVQGVYPHLDGNAFVTAVDPIPVTTVIIEGRGGMPAFFSILDPGEVAEVVTYIRGAWTNDASGIDEAEAQEAWERTGLPLEDEDEEEDEEEEDEEEEDEEEDDEDEDEEDDI